MFITLTIYKCYVICCLRVFWESVYNLEEDMPMQIKFKLQMYTNSLMILKMGENRSRKLKNERQYSVAKKMKTNNVLQYT